MNKRNIICIIGTRPEVIKMAPVIWALQQSEEFTTTIVNTAQHRSLLDEMLALFNISPNIDMNIMRDSQSLTDLTGNLFIGMNKIINPTYDFVIAQGDTTTTFVSAMVAFYNKIPFGHVEAGLRTYDNYNPFPEEVNRAFAGHLASLHFTPTDIEKNNLLQEKIPDSSIFVTGNTVIDSLFYWANKQTSLPFDLPHNKKIILLTLHRRESFGEPLIEMFSAFLQLIEKFSDVHIVYPVHPNPNVHEMAHKMLGNHPAITLLKPVRYDQFVELLKLSYLVCTDSGGIQEEAPALNKPLVILREETERPLVVDMGMAKLAGTEKSSIVNIVSKLLIDKNAYSDMQKNFSPYGDGHAAEQIINAISNFLKTK